MKVSTSKSSPTSIATDEQTDVVTGVPNQGVFDQLMQLLFASMALPIQTPSVENNTEALSTADPAVQIAINATNQNNLSHIPTDLVASSITSQGIDIIDPSQNDINGLFEQLTNDGANADVEQAKIALPQINSLINTSVNDQHNDGLDVNLNAISKEQFTLTSKLEDTLPQAVASENAQKAAESESDQDSTLSIVDAFKHKLDISHDNHTYNIKDKASVASMMNKAKQGDSIEITPKKSSETTLKADNDAQLSGQLPLSPLSSLPQPTEQHQRVMEAFHNIGTWINHKTASFVSSSNLTPAASTFDPRQDVQLEPTLSTFNFQLSDKYDARIRIYPPELGNVLAKLKMGKNGAELVLVAENAQVKEIVEANLSQLKQHFQQADIQLTQVEVQMAEADERKQQKDSLNKEQYNNNDFTTDQFTSNLIKKESKIDEDAIVDTYA